ncbi:MAG: alanine racemase [Acidaminococcaceae bacterium]|nr:alanine racemase [Acidaminococcaceae bacterium]
MHIQRGAWVEINLDSVAHNVQTAKRQLQPGTKLCAVVKADAYGHGAVRIAQEAARNGADFFAVALLQEAVQLREAGIDTPILVLGAMLPEVADLVVRYDISHAVFDAERVYALNEAALRQNKKARIHLAIDTGMHRIGVHVKEAGKFAQLANSLPGIYIEGAFSHFATADADDKEYAAYQFARFQEALALIEAAGVRIPLRHIANSAALTELQEYQLDMVRQGITLYGLHPAHMIDCYKNFEPVMTVKTQVAFLKKLPTGVTIGYGRSYTLQRETVVATVPVGYADGISRRLSNKGYMLINDEPAPIIGRVCMDQVMLDVTDIPDVRLGSEVTVFGGKNLPMELVADWADTICYELVCNVSTRMPREYVRGN